MYSRNALEDNDVTAKALVGFWQVHQPKASNIDRSVGAVRT